MRGREIVLEEETGVHGESGGEERLVDGACVVEEELRFDAFDTGRVVEELKELVEERLCDREGLRGVAVGCEGVSDNGFLAFVDAEGEAADAAAVEGDKAWEDAGVEILEEEFGGALIVPAKALLPEARLGFEQWAQLTRGKMTQVEDFELGRDCHTLFEVLDYELIGILWGWARDGGGVSGSLLLPVCRRALKNFDGGCGRDPGLKPLVIRWIFRRVEALLSLQKANEKDLLYCLG
jgi:hypothetical protein